MNEYEKYKKELEYQASLFPKAEFKKVTEDTGVAICNWNNTNGFYVYSYEQYVGSSLMQSYCFKEEVDILLAVHKAKCFIFDVD